MDGRVPQWAPLLGRRLEEAEAPVVEGIADDARREGAADVGGGLCRVTEGDSPPGGIVHRVQRRDDARHVWLGYHAPEEEGALLVRHRDPEPREVAHRPEGGADHRGADQLTLEQVHAEALRLAWVEADVGGSLEGGGAVRGQDPLLEGVRLARQARRLQQQPQGHALLLHRVGRLLQQQQQQGVREGGAAPAWRGPVRSRLPAVPVAEDRPRADRVQQEVRVGPRLVELPEGLDGSAPPLATEWETRELR